MSTMNDISQPQAGSGAPVILPSEMVPPTRSTTLPQQGNTQPDSGSALHSKPQEPGDIALQKVNVVTTPADGQSPTREVPFKERVIGVAKKTRGTLLGNADLKEHGEQILQGNASVHEPPHTSQ